MKDLYPLLSALPVDEARSALYYLCRYIKQAAIQDEYGKDIFDDDSRSAPSDVVCATTLKMIAFIEGLEGKPASEFDDGLFHFWIDHTFEVEDRLDPAISPRDADLAAAFLASMPKPKVKE